MKQQLALFGTVPLVKLFGLILKSFLFLNRKLDLHFKLKIEVILFGHFADEIPVNKMYVINLITLLAKFCIHASKFVYVRAPVQVHVRDSACLELPRACFCLLMNFFATHCNVHFVNKVYYTKQNKQTKPCA